MIKLIVGVKGTGKTKTLIDMVNAAVLETNGSVVFIEKGNKLIHEVKHQARLIDTEEYEIKDAQALYGFVAGIFASNHDITEIYIDSLLKICDHDVAAFEYLVNEFAAFAEKNNIKMVLTVSMPIEELPESIKKYL